MDIIIRDVEEVDDRYKVKYKDGVGGFFYVDKQTAEAISIPIEPPVILQTAEVYKDMTVDKIKAKLDYLIGEIGNYGEEYSGAYLPDLYELQELVSSLSK